jgi:membrane protease YdiL (CAAX protease family)
MTFLKSFFWQAVLVEGGLAVIAVIAAFCFGLNYWTYCRFDGETLSIIVLALLPLIVGYFFLQALPFANLRRIDRIVRDMFWQHMRHLTLGQLALIAALAGLGEELLFRGMIQLGLSAVFGVMQWCSILIASLIFGLAHAVTPTYCLLAFIISIYLGFLFMQTENLVIPIAVHALYDYLVFLLIRFTPQRGTFNVNAE